MGEIGREGGGTRGGDGEGTTGAAIRLLDAVAPTEDRPQSGLCRGQAGSVVEALAPGVYEAGFSDDGGRAYALRALRAEQLLVLHYEPASAP